MKREIKFRQWAKNRFYYWGIGIDENTFVGPVSGGGINASNTPQQQFTGLKDKNGKEIYEGDILRVCNGSINGARWWDKEPWIVQYQNGRGFTIPGFCWTPEGDDDMDSTHFCEVIGNIHENPELLTDGLERRGKG